MTQSVCTTPRGRMSLKPRQSFMGNKENNQSQVYQNEKKKGLQLINESDLKINEIKKILMSNDDSDSKVCDIQKIIYGSS